MPFNLLNERLRILKLEDKLATLKVIWAVMIDDSPIILQKSTRLARKGELSPLPVTVYVDTESTYKVTVYVDTPFGLCRY